MELYFPVISKPSSLRTAKKDAKNRQSVKFHPYDRPSSKSEKPPIEQIAAPSGRFWEPHHDGSASDLSNNALTRHILKTLSDKSNPITHSDIAQRTEHIYSTSTGHQVAEGRRRIQYVELEKDKRKTQMKAAVEGCEDNSHILRGVRAYISGYLENTTDLELRRIITRAGGEILWTASGCTHIITSRHLSGSKTQKLLVANPSKRIHVVRPEWVMDSIKTGKRLNERRYTVLRDESVQNLYQMLSTGSGSN